MEGTTLTLISVKSQRLEAMMEKTFDINSAERLMLQQIRTNGSSTL